MELGLGISQHLHKELLPVVEEDEGGDAGLSFIIAAAESPLDGIPHLGRRGHCRDTAHRGLGSSTALCAVLLPPEQVTVPCAV